MIQYHRNIQTYKTIPRKFKPPTVTTTVQPKANLIDDFNKKYDKLFFEYLQKIISHNNITLVLTKAALENIVTQTEIYLCSLQLPKELLTVLYHKFLTDNHITNYYPLPTLQCKLHVVPNQSQLKTDTITKVNRARRKDKSNTSIRPLQIYSLCAIVFFL